MLTVYLNEMTQADQEKENIMFRRRRQYFFTLFKVLA